MSDKLSTRIGWTLSGIVILFLVMDLAMKFAVLPFRK